MVGGTLIHPGANPEFTAKTWGVGEFREGSQLRGFSRTHKEVVSVSPEVKSGPSHWKVWTCKEVRQRHV